jgi:hypothetical protein
VDASAPSAVRFRRSAADLIGDIGNGDARGHADADEVAEAGPVQSP